MIRDWIRYTLLYLIIAALLGLFLRINLIFPIEGVNFRYWVHAHSHVAFLGWIFNALFCGIIYAYIPEKARKYSTLFIALQVAVLGMLVTFPFQGYAAASITFSTLHIFLTWWFVVRFFRDTKSLPQRYAFSFSLIKWGLVFMVLSAIGPFALGAIMAQGLSGTPIADLAIYFYLHFQYNGLFTFVVFGFFFLLLERKGISFSMAFSRVFLRLLIISCFTGYVLSTLWTKPGPWVFGIGIITAVLLLASLMYFLLLLKAEKKQIAAKIQKPVLNLFIFSLCCYCLKIAMQAASAFPYFADLAYKVRNLPIGFLHLVFLGFISVFLIGWFFEANLIKIKNDGAFCGIWIFIAGFVLSEIILFAQHLLVMLGFYLPYGNEMLAAISVLMPLGFVVLYLNTSFATSNTGFKSFSECADAESTRLL